MKRIAIGIVLALLVCRTSEVAAKELAWQGTLAVELEPLDPIHFRGSGVATVNGSGSGLQLTRLRVAGGIAGSTTIPVTDPDLTATLASIRVSPQLGTGTLSPFWPIEPWPDPQLVENVLPVGGAIRLCSFDPGCSSAQILPLTLNDGRTGIGAGGLIPVGGFGNLRVSIAADPWTVYTAALTVDTLFGGTAVRFATGWLHGPSSFSTSVARVGGALQLVTPVEIRADTGLYLPGFSKLTIVFTPEPSHPVLLGSGLLALVGLGNLHARRTHGRPRRLRAPTRPPRSGSG